MSSLNLKLKFLWFGSRGIGVALDQKFLNRVVPVTEYFFWPKSDAWDDMRVCLKSSPWITQNELVLILNQLTEVINFWQEKSDLSQDSFDLIKSKFPDCEFVFCV